MSELNVPHIPKEEKPQSIWPRLILTFLILGAAVAVASYFIAFPKKTEKKNQDEHKVVLVTAETFETGDHPVIVEVMGQVTAAREINLKAQVSGEIINIAENFIPGGFIEKGQEIVKIDPRDYMLDLEMRQAAAKQSQADLMLEEGQQKIAQNELKILQDTTGKKLKSTDLALRKPQLESARAAMESAQSAVKTAKINLERTSVSVPFNALITERMTNLGNVISTQDTLATLVGTDEYWIMADIPVHNLHWIEVPAANDDAPGSNASIQMDRARGQRQGHVLKTNGKLDERSRMAGILISVPDPLLLNDNAPDAAPLVIGDFVKVSITGKTLKDILKLPKQYIRENSTIWVLRNNTLLTPKADIMYEDRNYAYVYAEIEKSDMIVTSDIITPVDGMEIALRTEEKPAANDNMQADQE